ncbi:MAG: YeiH family protein [Planctomycetota bacterium]
MLVKQAQGEIDLRWLDSYEGVPEWPQPRETAGEQAARGRVRQSLHAALEAIGQWSPGLVLTAALAWAGVLLADLIGKQALGFDRSPVSPILVTVLLGLIVRNVAGLPKVYEQGLRLCVRRVLRVGIVLLGLQLSLSSLGSISAAALPIVVCCIVAAIVLVTWLGKLVRLPARLATLIAVGTSICGVSAVVATGPVIEAEDEEVSYAVACVTLFGMVALFCYPFLAHALFGDARQAGIFLGTAIHDTSQVAGAGLMYRQYFGEPEALAVATTTKLVRNLCMGAVIPLLAVLYRRGRSDSSAATKGRLAWSQWLPLFVVVFAAMAVVRTVGDYTTHQFGVPTTAQWEYLLKLSHEVSIACLALAMAAVGLGTSFKQLWNLGWKPLFVGLIAATIIGVVSSVLIKMLIS